MGEAVPTIPTRQQAERIVSTTKLLAASGTFVSAALRAEGYNAVLGLAVCDQAGTLRVLQAGETVDAKGNAVPDVFVQTNVLPTALDPFTGKQVVQINAPVIAAYVKLEYDNSAAVQGQFNLIGYLVPDAGLATVTATVVIPPLAAIEIKDSATTTELSVQQDGAAVPVADPDDAGGALIAGRDGASQFHLRMAGALAPQPYGTKRALVDSVMRANDGTNYSAVQGLNIVAGSTSEFAFAMAVRAGLTAFDPGQPAGFRNVPLEAVRGILASDLSVVQGRGTGFRASERGQRFAVTQQDRAIVTAGSAVFDATKPLLMVRGAALINIVLRSLKLILVNAITARIAIVLDTADRFSAGGAAVTPQNMNANSVTAFPGTSFLTNPTATAAGAGTRLLFNDRILSGPNAGEFQSEDSWQTTGAQTMLVYAYDAAGAAAPQMEYDVDLEAK